jgi:hypothetical protein
MKLEIEELEDIEEENIGMFSIRSLTQLAYDLDDLINKSLNTKVSCLKLNSSKESLVNNLNKVHIQFISSSVTSKVSGFFKKDISDIELKQKSAVIADKIYKQIQICNENKFKDCFIDIIKAGVEVGLGDSNCKKYDFKQLDFIVKIQYMQFERLGHTIGSACEYLDEVNKYIEIEAKKLVCAKQDKKKKHIKYKNLDNEKAILSGYEYNYNKDSIENLDNWFSKIVITFKGHEYYYAKAVQSVLIECDYQKLRLEKIEIKDIEHYCGYATDCQLNVFINEERTRLFEECFNSAMLFLGDEQNKIQEKISNAKWHKKAYNGLCNLFGLLGIGGMGGMGIAGGSAIMVVGGTAGAAICPPALIAGGVIIGGSIVVGGVAGVGLLVSTAGISKILENRECYSYAKMLDIIYLAGKQINKVKLRKLDNVKMQSFDNICLNSKHKYFHKDLEEKETIEEKQLISFVDMEDSRNTSQSNSINNQVN